MGAFSKKIRAMVIGSAVFAITFSIIFPIVSGETQRNYAQLLAAWNSPSMSLTELRDISSSVARESQNDDLQFVAKQLTTTASLWSELGYAQLGDIKSASSIEYFGRAFLEGYVNPAVNLKTIPLWWNAKKFEQASAALDLRNRRMRLLRWTMAGGVALAWFCLIGAKNKPTDKPNGNHHRHED